METRADTQPERVDLSKVYLDRLEKSTAIEMLAEIAFFSSNGISIVDFESLRGKNANGGNEYTIQGIQVRFAQSEATIGLVRLHKPAGQPPMVHIDSKVSILDALGIEI